MKKLLKGELPLVKTFWIYGVGVMAVLFFIMNKAYEVVQKAAGGYDVAQIAELYNNPADISPEFLNASLLYFVVMFLTTIYSLIINVAVWRSSAKYEGEVIWKYGSRALMVFGLFDSLTGI